MATAESMRKLAETVIDSLTCAMKTDSNVLHTLRVEPIDNSGVIVTVESIDAATCSRLRETKGVVTEDPIMFINMCVDVIDAVSSDTHDDGTICYYFFR